MDKRRLQAAVADKIVVARNKKNSLIVQVSEQFKKKLLLLGSRSAILSFLKDDQDMYGEAAFNALSKPFSAGGILSLFKSDKLNVEAIDGAAKTLSALLSHHQVNTLNADTLLYRDGIRQLRGDPLKDGVWDFMQSDIMQHSNWRVFWHDNIALLQAISDTMAELESLAKTLLNDNVETLARAARSRPTRYSNQAQSGSYIRQRHDTEHDSIFPEWLWWYWILEESSYHTNTNNDIEHSASLGNDVVDEITGVAAAAYVSVEQAESLGSYS